MGENNLLHLEGTCRVITMIIDWKEEENYSKRSELTIMNSSENDISNHKFTIIPPRKRFEDKHTLLYG
jgi:hypothetical protein